VSPPQCRGCGVACVESSDTLAMVTTALAGHEGSLIKITTGARIGYRWFGRGGKPKAFRKNFARGV